MQHNSTPVTFGGLAPGTHLCHLYQTDQEYQAVLAPLLHKALDRGAQVICIGGAHTAERVCALLLQEGFDPEACLPSGQLVFVAGAGAQALALVQSQLVRAKQENRSTLQVVCEMSEMLQSEATLEVLTECEARLDALLADSQCILLCQYDRRQISPELALEALSAHPWVALGAAIQENQYYVPPDRYAGRHRAATRLESWLENLAGQAPHGSSSLFQQLAENIQDLNQDLERRALEKEALNNAIQAIASTLDLKTILDMVMSEVRRLLHAEGASILMYDDGAGELEFAAATGPGSEQLTGKRMPADMGIAGWVVHEQRAVLVSEAHSDPRFFDRIDQVTGLDTHSLLAVPLAVKGSIRGVVEAINKAGGSFDDHDRDVLETMAHSAAIAIENARLFAAVGAELAERERVEVALRASEERFRLLAENAQDVIFLYRLQPEPGFEYISPAAEAITGYTPDEFYADPQFYLNLIHLANPLPEREIDVLSERSAVVRLIRKDGESIWVEQRFTPLCDASGQVVAIEGVAREVTERERAKEQLERHNRDLAALNAIYTAIGQSHDQTLILQAMLDKVIEVVGVDAGWIWLLDPRHPGRLVLSASHGHLPEGVELDPGPHGDNLAARVIQSGRSVIVDSLGDWGAEGGGQAFCLLVGIPLKFQDRVLGILGVASRDSRALADSPIHLLTTIGHQMGTVIENVQLAQAAAEIEVLREMDRLRSELVANVSHELRTPLGLIKVFATTLLRQDVELGPDVQREFLGDIDRETDNLEKIVDNLLDISRVQSGRLRLDRQPADLGQVMRTVAQEMLGGLERHELVLDLPAGPIVAPVDVRRLGQVLRNLIGNAVKYSPQGGPIVLSLRGEEGQVLVRIKDDGIGIPPQDLSRVFERFYRVDSPLTRSVSGVGLGLAVCQGIVEAHGGRIWAESGLGEPGTIINFTLPMHTVPNSQSDLIGATFEG